MRARRLASEADPPLVVRFLGCDLEEVMPFVLDSFVGVSAPTVLHRFETLAQRERDHDRMSCGRERRRTVDDLVSRPLNPF